MIFVELEGLSVLNTLIFVELEGLSVKKNLLKHYFILFTIYFEPHKGSFSGINLKIKQGLKRKTYK